MDNEFSTPKRRVAIYIRVSTAEQRIDGYSLDAQERRLLEFIEQNKGLQLEGSKEWIYEDTHTGSDLSRPGLMRLLEDVKKGKYEAVLVWKIDRLSRSLKHLITIFEDFKDKGVSFISVQENIDFRGPIGTLIFQLFGAIAQFERELIKGRTRMGKMESAASGNFIEGKIPYGYRPIIEEGRKGKRIEVVPEEKEIIEKMYRWYIFDGMGDLKIAKKLNDQRVTRNNWVKDKNDWIPVPSTTGWTTKIVTKILTSELYRGDYIPFSTDDEGNELPDEKKTVLRVPACISEMTFQHAAAIRSGKVNLSRTDYVLSGKLYDMSVDKPRPFSGAKRSKGGFSYRRKQFTLGNKNEPVFEMPGKQVEDFIWNKVLAAMKNPEKFIKTYLAKAVGNKTKIEAAERELDRLRNQLAQKMMESERVESAHESGLYSIEKAQKKLALINEAMEKLNDKVLDLEEQLALLGSVHLEVSKLREASSKVKYRLEKLDRRGKKLLCQLFIDHIEVHRSPLPKKGKRNEWKTWYYIAFRFNPERLTETMDRGRKTFPQKKAENTDDGGKKSSSGGRGWI